MEDVSIRWSGFAGANVAISLLKNNELIGYMGTFSNTGSTQIDITELIGTGAGFKFKIIDDYGNTATSSSFSIDPLYVYWISNNGYWQRGHYSCSVKWNGIGDEAFVELYQGSSSVFDLSDGWINNTGQFECELEIPENWPGGSDYKVQVTLRNATGNEYRGFSENITLPYSDNQRQGANSIRPGDTISGELINDSDIDYFMFRAAENMVYTVKLSGDEGCSLVLRRGGGSLESCQTGGRVKYTCYNPGECFINITGPAGYESQTYEIQLSEGMRPERHRKFGGWVGYTYTGADSIGYSGVDCGFFYSPIRYTEIGINAYVIGYTNSGIVLNKFTYCGGWVGLRSPRIWKMELLAGASYDFRLSGDEWYYTPEDEVATPPQDGSFRPYVGVDFLVQGQRYESITTIRLGISFFEEGQWRIVAGLGYSG